MKGEMVGGNNENSYLSAIHFNIAGPVSTSRVYPAR